MRQFFAVLRISFIDCLTYRTDILLYTLSGLVFPLISLGIWLALIHSGGTTPYSGSQIVTYFLLVTIVNIWISAWAGIFISRDIRTGELSKYLLKPYRFIYHQLGNNLAEKVFKTLTAVPVIVLVMVFLRPELPGLSPDRLFLFAVSLVLAVGMNFLFDICIGLLAFWLEDTASVGESLNVFALLLSGYTVPLWAFPEPIFNLAKWLPFRYHLSFPIEIYQNLLDPSGLIFGFTVQIIWLVLLIAVCRWLWATGLRRFSAYGS